jgi:hypothetical protein
MIATRIRRSFVASPVRLASVTWSTIIETVAPEGAPGRPELVALTGVAASLIAGEAWRYTPVVVSGVGPQLRIYCLHGEDAIVGDDRNEEPLTWSPTDGDWSIRIPCLSADLEWVTAAISEISPRISIDDGTSTRTSSRDEIVGEQLNQIDVEAFLRG